MDYHKRFDQVEGILADVLRVQDRLAAGQEQLANGQESLVTGRNRLLKTVDRMAW